jgi:hypothetical protein
MFRFHSIGEIQEKIKGLLDFFGKREIYIITVIILVGCSSYFIGRLSHIFATRKPVTIEYSQVVQTPQKPLETLQNPQQTASLVKTIIDDKIDTKSAQAPIKGLYVGSKNSNKYHLPTCPGALKIAKANQIWFASKSEAERAGYSPAGNCKGL